MADRYDPAAFEAKWRAKWKADDLFRTREDPEREKFYGLDFFPYPSGAGLSVGHLRNYVPGDVVSRMKYMQGFNVLHPMGFDAFGLPAENEAIKQKAHPGQMIERYAATYRRQMDLVGISYDWSRSFKSCDADFYKWTQWIFELLFSKGLAYRGTAAVNWDPVDKTVLADEEVIAGRAERSGALVERRMIPQWFFKITEYAQRLIDDLDKVDWPEGIKAQQRNWIGRSEGVQFTIHVAGARKDDVADDGFTVVRHDRELHFEVFTTRIDTVFGMTFCVLAPEHPMLTHLLPALDAPRRAAVKAYIEQAKSLTDADRTATVRDKTGVDTGAKAINPSNGEHVPIFVADYVLATYGTGAIMAVPGHDSRDYEFATKFGVPVRQVIAPGDGTEVQLPFEVKDGVLVNSHGYDGLPVDVAQTRLGEWIEALGIGERKVQYRLRDWLISRQRYWGCPIPIIHSAEGEMQLVAQDCLPVLLPDVDNYEPSGDGSSPLALLADFVNVTDNDGRLGHRETDTMGGFACSSWYFLRFCDPFNDRAAWDIEKVAYWMPVDCYVGGAEHAVMHLLYARFWTKVLYDAGLVPVDEPFQKLRNQGQMLAKTPYRQAREGEDLATGEDGIQISFEEVATMPEEDVFYRWARMSKSKGNVVTPDEAVASHGADALRVYELFVAPFNQDVQWSTDGMQGASRFLSRVFKLIDERRGQFDSDWKTKIETSLPDERYTRIRRATHHAIQRASEDIDKFAFNTYISELMKFANSLNEELARLTEPTPAQFMAISEALETFVLLIAPAAPHSSDELWAALGKTGYTYHERWPRLNPKLAAVDVVTVAVQVNGKLRDTLQLAAGSAQADLEQAAMASPKVQAHLDGKTVRKVIIVPDKLVNVVAN